MAISTPGSISPGLFSICHWLRGSKVNTSLDLEKILCVHGGLSPDLPMIEDIYTLERVAELGEKGPLADLLWSDPDFMVE